MRRPARLLMTHAKRPRDLKRDCLNMKQVCEDRMRQRRAYEERLERGQRSLAGDFFRRAD